MNHIAGILRGLERSSLTDKLIYTHAVFARRLHAKRVSDKTEKAPRGSLPVSFLVAAPIFPNVSNALLTRGAHRPLEPGVWSTTGNHEARREMR